ncbi:DUF7674 family protein [Bacillus sp. Hm123]|uniref:DUF7674 family protein n=1 Tax=Bacillus sp. Hm123 TaxID=3450745 RepID=UPI003F42E306
MKNEISTNEVMKLLLQACPSYQTRWEEYVKDNYETGEEHLLYIDLSDFSAHIIDLYKQNKIDEFPAVFEVIELLHTSGDDYVKEASTIGLLEDMQNQLLTDKIDTSVFKQFLKQDSLKWWNNLNDFWGGQTKYVGGPEK